MPKKSREHNLRRDWYSEMPLNFFHNRNERKSQQDFSSTRSSIKFDRRQQEPTCGQECTEIPSYTVCVV